VDVNAELAISDALRHLKEGSVGPLRDPDARPPAVIIGNQLKDDTGLLLKSVATVVSPEGQLTPMGPEPSIRKFRIAGVFETDFYEIDDLWAYTSIEAVQKALSLDDVVNQIELKVDDLNRAPEIASEISKAIGSHYTATAWQEKNHALLNSMTCSAFLLALPIRSAGYTGRSRTSSPRANRRRARRGRSATGSGWGWSRALSYLGFSGSCGNPGG